MLEFRIVNGAQEVSLFDLPAALGRTQAAKKVGETIEGLIAFLDDLGGDPDVEANGDELDGNNSEDDFMYHGGGGPGCPIADPDCCAANDDTGTDHYATHKIGFDRRQGGLECEDAESTNDREGIDEREPDHGDRCDVTL